jgi:hypothetical protein
VKLELPPRIASRGQEQHRAAHRCVQLVFEELELGARDEREGHDPFVLTSRGEHLLDLAEDVAHEATRYDQGDEGRAR